MRKKVFNLFFFFYLLPWLICPSDLCSALGKHSDIFQRSTPTGWNGKVESKDGIRTISNPDRPILDSSVLDLEEDLVIGSSKGKQSQFNYRFSMALDHLSNIYVLDPHSYQISKFDSNGNFIKSIGRQGQGPGEIASDSASILMIDDQNRLFVLDNFQIHIFNMDGEYVKTIKFPYRSSKAIISSNQDIIFSHLDTDTEGNQSETVSLAGPDGGIIKKIKSFLSEKWNAVLKQKARFTQFYPELIMAQLRKDSFLFGYSSEYTLYAINAKGEILFIIRKAEPQKKITNEEKNQKIEDILSQLKSRNPGRTESKSELTKRTYFPDTWRYYESIYCDDNGYIFIEKTRSNLDKRSLTELDLFNPEGYYLSKLIIPLKLDVCLINNENIYCRRYNADSETIDLVRYRIKNWPKIIASGNPEI